MVRVARPAERKMPKTQLANCASAQPTGCADGEGDRDGAGGGEDQADQAIGGIVRPEVATHPGESCGWPGWTLQERAALCLIHERLLLETGVAGSG